MEQIGSEYNFNTGGSIKALNDLIAKVEQLDKQVNKVNTDTKTAGNTVASLPTKTAKASSGFDALGNSINQVTREFPAFAFSAQTGFLAVSNNIPILIDSINQLKVANAALTAEGKASIPIWKQVISSLFSWQTALSLAISFSVMYGKEIGNFIGNLFSGKDAIDKATLSLTNYNKAIKETNYKQSISDINQLRVNISLYKDGLLTQKEVVDEFNKSLGKSSTEIKSVAEAEDFLVKKGPAFIRMTFLKTAALTAQSDASRSYVDEQILLAKREEVLATNKIAIERETQNIIANGERGALKFTKKTQEERAAEEIKVRSLVQRRYTKEFDQQIIDLDKQNKILLQISDDAFKQAAKIANGYDLSLYGDDTDLKKILTEFERLKQEESDLLLNIENGILDKADISKDVAKLDIVREKLKGVQDVMDLINGKTFEEALKQMEEWGKEANAQGEKDLKERRKNEKKSIEDGLLAIEMEYAKKKEEKVLNTKEELELERGKQLAMISYLNKFSTMDEEIQKDIFERKIKLSEQNSKINKEDFQQGIKDEDAFLAAQLNANGNYFLDLRNEREYSAKELAQIDVQEAQSKVDLFKFVNKEDKESKDRLLKAEQDLKDAKIRLAKETNKEVLDDDKKAAKEKQQLLSAASEISLDIANGYFDLQRNQLKAETDMQMSELDKQKEAKLIGEEEYNTKKKALLNESARKQREYDLAQIKVLTAIAILKALATALSPAAAAIGVSFAISEGIIQYAFAAAQPLPQFAKGTDMVKGGIRGKDSVHALLMPQEAVIPTKENLARPGLAKAWIDGNLDRHLMMNYIKPAIDENNRRWEATLKVNQNSTFIRNDNFSDKKIVLMMDKNNRLTKNVVSELQKKDTNRNNSRRNWN